jgi:hypothetical protein
MASSYLSRTPASAGNRTTWTYSFWLKKTKITGDQVIFSAGIAGNDTICYFQSADHSIHWFNRISSSMTATRITSQVFRDVSAWYHFVFVWDTTNSTALDRMRIYLNGSQITSFSSTLNPSSSLNSFWNSTNAHQIMSDNSPPANLSDGLLASVYFIDGQALTPSSFGQTDATTGIWKPLSYSGTYGTNGFYLKFANSASLGTDSSGNGNNFTVNGTPTQTVDTPSNVFATMNPLDTSTYSTTGTFAQGNLSLTTNSSNNCGTRSTIAATQGKWYWECKWTNDPSTNQQEFGIMRTTSNINANSGNFGQNSGYCVVGNGYKWVNGSYSNASLTFATNDILMCAMDLDNNYVYIGRNGTWLFSGVPTSGSSGTGAFSSLTSGDTWSPAFGSNYINPAVSLANFGNPSYTANGYTDGAGKGNFSYSVPSGYFALCTANLSLYG